MLGTLNIGSTRKRHERQQYDPRRRRRTFLGRDRHCRRQLRGLRDHGCGMSEVLGKQRVLSRMKRHERPCVFPCRRRWPHFGGNESLGMSAFRVRARGRGGEMLGIQPFQPTWRRNRHAQLRSGERVGTSRRNHRRIGRILRSLCGNVRRRRKMLGIRFVLTKRNRSRPLQVDPGERSAIANIMNPS